MKTVYCSNCGKRLSVTRKALPKYAAIINLVEWHECSNEPVEFDLTPVELPIFESPKGKDKFVKKLNDLQPSKPFGISTADFRDRRFEKEPVKSTAPLSLTNLFKTMEIENSTPERGMENVEDVKEDN